jgi:hypothetical protein
MASWDYEPVSVPVARGGERDADLGLQPEERQVAAAAAAEPDADRSEEVDPMPFFNFGPTKGK